MLRRYISRFRIREMERTEDRRRKRQARRQMRFSDLFRWINKGKATVIYPEKKDDGN